MAVLAPAQHAQRAAHKLVNERVQLRVQMLLPLLHSHTDTLLQQKPGVSYTRLPKLVQHSQEFRKVVFWNDVHVRNEQFSAVTNVNLLSRLWRLHLELA